MTNNVMENSYCCIFRLIKIIFVKNHEYEIRQKSTILRMTEYFLFLILLTRLKILVYIFREYNTSRELSSIFHEEIMDINNSW